MSFSARDLIYARRLPIFVCDAFWFGRGKSLNFCGGEVWKESFSKQGISSQWSRGGGTWGRWRAELKSGNEKEEKRGEMFFNVFLDGE